MTETPRRALAFAAIVCGLASGIGLGACCPTNGNRAPLLSTTLTSPRFGGFAAWGESVVDDDVIVEIDLGAETVVVRHTSEGHAIVYTYAITEIDENAWE